MKLLTNLIFEPKGKHDPALAYSIKDTVMSADGSQVYFALQDVPAGTALDNEDYWKLQIDMHDTLVDMQEAAEAAKGAVSANVDQNLTETQKATARRNIGMDKVIESLSDPLEASGNPLVVKPVGGMPFDSVVTEFSPKQEGSGDPYPMGGGKNLAKSCYTSTSRNQYVESLYIEADILPNTTYTLSFVTSSGVGNKLYLNEKISEYRLVTMAGERQNITFTTKDNISSEYVDGKGWIIFKNANAQTEATTYSDVQLEIGSTATSYAPPENIRPLSGWDKLDLNAAGKNLLNNTAANGTKNGITFTINADGTLTANGTATADVHFAIGKPNLKPNTQYILTGAMSDASRLYYDSGNGYAWDYGSGAKFVTGAVVSGNGFVSTLIRSGTVLNNAVFKPMIRLASIADATFEPYHNDLHTIQIGQTVYGGRAEWCKGKLVAEWAVKILDGSETWYLNGSGNSAYFHTSHAVDVENASLIQASGKCSHYPVVNVTTTNVVQGVSGWGTTLYLRYAALFSTVDEIAAYHAAQYAAGTPVQIAYKLATPIEIQLPATEIIALPGTNTLYGDGDSITVTGRQPQTNALESRLAALEAVITNA